jgi:signal transduction histidine kinase/HAMP domain-containing protein
MNISLRPRIILTLAPFLVLLVLLSAAAAILLHDLGGRIDAILRENFDSVLYMESLNEALERIDSSFQFALAGEEDKARSQYTANWKLYRDSLVLEQGNITLPGEGDLVARLAQLTERYEHDGKAFYARLPKDVDRRLAYFGTPDGLLHTFNEIKDVSGRILRLNQAEMEDASRRARRAAHNALIIFGVALVGCLAIWIFLTWRTCLAILRPISEMTQSALAIGHGNLHQVVPVTSHDELGQLANAFNVMARQLRGYRETGYSRLLRAQRTSQATIDSFPDPVLVVDPERHVEMANPAARRYLGVVAANPDQPPRPAWEPPTALHDPLEDALTKQQSYLPEGFDRAIVLHSDGQERFLLPHVMPISDPYGNTLGAAILLHDVTRFRLLDQVKSDLVATVSHEFKTPLTSLRLAVHLLLEESVGPLTPKQTELLVDARDNSELLLARVNRLLDMTRLQAGRQQLDLAPVAPAELVRAAEEAFRPRAQDKDIAFIVDVAPDLPDVCADADRMGYALGNLLDNSLTHTERGGKITLSVAKGADGVTFYVTDTGRGIAPEHLPHIFEKFYRVPGQSKQGGTGLGLAIVQEIVAAHDGEVACDSRPAKGTVFSIRLPRWMPPLKDSSRPALASPLP